MVNMTTLYVLQNCVQSLVARESILFFILLQGNTDAVFSAKFFHILYILLQLDPPWKSPSMLRYYLELLQCPICMKGTWSLLEMLVR